MLHKKFQSNHSDAESISASVVKIVSVASVVLALLLGLSRIGGTLSYFSDVELSVANMFKAGTLFIDISSTIDEEGRIASSSEEAGEGIGSETFEIGINTEESSLPVLYQAHAELSIGNPLGCEDIALTADFGEYHYEGPLLNFLSTPVSEDGWWTFTISLPSNSILPDGALCNGEIVFVAKVDGTHESAEDTFTDEKDYYFTLRNVSAPAATTDTPTQATSTEEVSETSYEVQTTSLIYEEDVPVPIPPQPAGDTEVLENNDTSMTDEILQPDINQTPNEPTPKEPTPPPAE